MNFFESKELQESHGGKIVEVMVSQIPRKRVKAKNLNYEKALIVVDMGMDLFEKEYYMMKQSECNPKTI